VEADISMAPVIIYHFQACLLFFAGSNFTIEFWANFSDVGVYRPILSRRADCNAYTTLTLDIGRQADNKINATFVVGINTNKCYIHNYNLSKHMV